MRRLCYRIPARHLGDDWIPCQSHYPLKVSRYCVFNNHRHYERWGTAGCDMCRYNLAGIAGLYLCEIRHRGSVLRCHQANYRAGRCCCAAGDVAKYGANLPFLLSSAAKKADALLHFCHTHTSSSSSYAVAAILFRFSDYAGYGCGNNIVRYCGKGGMVAKIITRCRRSSPCCHAADAFLLAVRLRWAANIWCTACLVRLGCRQAAGFFRAP